MSDARDEVETLLSERFDLEGPLVAILEVDRELETWEFDDVPVDSGPFGELVSRGVIEKNDDGYELADQQAVAAALGEEAESANVDDSVSVFRTGGDLSIAWPSIGRRFAGLVAGVFALVVLFRVVPYESVFRGGDVVLSANDPYLYRYFVEKAIQGSSSSFDFNTLSVLPNAKGEPLLVATLWFVAELIGGSQSVGTVLAWYPVMAGLVSAGLLYMMTVRVTDDRRVGLAGVGLLAVTPVHAFRTGVGFADHHAFDYVWLGLTAWTLVVLSDYEVRDWQTWGSASLLGLGVGGQTMAWEAGPLMLVPLGLYVAVLVPSVVRADKSPTLALAPVAVGVGFGAALSHLAHTGFGWHTTVVAYVPTLLLGGVLGLTILGEVVYRIDLDPRALVGTEVVVAIAGVVVFPSVFPTVATALNRGINFLTGTGGVAETQSIFAGALGNVAAPLTLFGLAFFLGLPYLAWTSWRAVRRHEPGWLVPTTYAYFFFALSLFQIRFTGQLSVFLAVFAGLGLVHVLAWIDLAKDPAPFVNTAGGSSLLDDSGVSADGGDSLDSQERRDIVRTAGTIVGIGGLGALLTPIKHSQVTIDRSMYRAASVMRSYATDRGWEYPENYVFSDWGDNRFYNYFVNGESRSYAFAQSNFEEFLGSQTPREWYRRLTEANRDGFIIASETPGADPGEETMYGHLVDDWGERTGHYRPIWTNRAEERTAYVLVPGATVTGPGDPGEMVSLSMEADLGTRTVELERSVEVNEFGIYTATMALPGTVSDGNIRDITNSDVESGGRVSGFEGPGAAYWSFNEGSGETAYDRAGGYHATINDVSWTDEGVSGGALRFDGRAEQYVRAPIPVDGSFSLSLWIRPSVMNATEQDDFQDIVRTDKGTILRILNNGRLSFRLPRSDSGPLIASGRINSDSWHHVVLTFDGSRRTVYVDDEERATDTVSHGRTDLGSRIRMGSRRWESDHAYTGRLDEVRLFGRALSDQERL